MSVVVVCTTYLRSLAICFCDVTDFHFSLSRHRRSFVFLSSGSRASTLLTRQVRALSPHVCAEVRIAHLARLRHSVCLSFLDGIRSRLVSVIGVCGVSKSISFLSAFSPPSMVTLLPASPPGLPRRFFVLDGSLPAESPTCPLRFSCPCEVDGTTPISPR